MAWALATAPFLWVGGEWIRGHLLGGFPWGTLGYSQYLRLPVIQVAEFGGVHAVSLVLVAVNAALAGVFVLGVAAGPRRGVLVGGALVATILGFGTWRLREPPPSADARGGHAAVHRAAAQVRAPSRREHPVDLRGADAAGRRRAPALIVWPETALPTALRRDPDLPAALAALVGGAAGAAAGRLHRRAGRRARAASATPRSSSASRGSSAGMIRFTSFRSENMCRFRV